MGFARVLGLGLCTLLPLQGGAQPTITKPSSISLTLGGSSSGTASVTLESTLRTWWEFSLASEEQYTTSTTAGEKCFVYSTTAGTSSASATSASSTASASSSGEAVSASSASSDHITGLGSPYDEKGRRRWGKGRVIIGYDQTVHPHTRRRLRERLLSDGVVASLQVIKKASSGDEEDYAEKVEHPETTTPTEAEEATNGTTTTTTTTTTTVHQAPSDFEIDVAILTDESDENLAAILESLEDEDGVEFVEPDYYVHKNDATINDDFFTAQWHLNACINGGQDCSEAANDIDAMSGWQITTGSSSSMVLAVLDSGVDYNHPDLSGKMWTNSGETPNDGVDNDGNGYTDDYYGYNFANGNGDPMDDDSDGHGTHVGTTAFGECGNSEGTCGVMWGGKVMGLKCLDSSGSGLISGFVLAIYYARTYGAKVMVNSYGSGACSTAFAVAVRDAYGSAFIAAAGNEATNLNSGVSYPASFAPYLPWVSAIGASTVDGAMSSFSNYGNTVVSVLAPGSDIIAAENGGGVRSLSGTSMATPIVAGIAAVVTSQFPKITPAQVVASIERSAPSFTAATGTTIFGGIANLKAALEWAESNVVVSPQTLRQLSSGNSSFTIDLYANSVGKSAGTYTDTLIIRYQYYDSGWSSLYKTTIPITITISSGSGSALGSQTVSITDQKATRMIDERGTESGTFGLRNHLGEAAWLFLLVVAISMPLWFRDGVRR
uniref:subtilisin n=1 Tax=Chromera velia CCMP2878 TaxID=1169474 RepID=A0A0G4HSX4_9ALVE|eukprot:Cvel_1329.t1-p1 / transcript=Cvel_1329.t1 / gene=Cvel_1329 / organism=Chromera_velia_CCMP2878 / gene_product=Thermophilic serine proteinase, putative / transcript_product=Thermophilic serine proteinase, putative / location=Cvel_scaffold45:96399-101183(-) / protein_length=718 / sequence_SO=supercontig / SO=protein_coding / is_pseudo=false